MFKNYFLLPVCSLLFFSACLRNVSPITPGIKVAAVNIANQYLLNIINNRSERALGSILWAEYVQKPGKQFTKSAYAQQMENIAGLWPKNEHPLVGFNDVQFYGNGEAVTVILKKKQKPQDAEVRILLVWTGSSWAIADDNIFGTKGFISALQSQS